jgi:hypothetical protein
MANGGCTCTADMRSVKSGTTAVAAARGDLPDAVAAEAMRAALSTGTGTAASRGAAYTCTLTDPLSGVNVMAFCSSSCSACAMRWGSTNAASSGTSDEGTKGSVP